MDGSIGAVAPTRIPSEKTFRLAAISSICTIGMGVAIINWSKDISWAITPSIRESELTLQLIWGQILDGR